MFRHIRWRLLATYLIVVSAALVFLGVHLGRQFEGALGMDARETVSLEAQVRHVRWVVAWAVLVALGISAAVGILLARSIAGPVQEMQRVAGDLAAGRFQERVPVRTRDELGDLAGSLNDMADELERLDASRRAFVADASHELRTPVANLVVAVEALQAALDRDAHLARTLAADVEKETHRLRELVEHLLDLSQVEAGSLNLAIEPLPVLSVIERSLAPFQARAEAARLRLDVRVPPGISAIRADAVRAVRVLANLLDNAVKFTPPGGRIVVTAAERRETVEVSVGDTGPGIPPGEESQIFGRFYRVDKARARGRGGAGLGLAIARRLAEAQGGSISVRNREEGGALFTVAFPKHN
jgi:two-component system sensor histidine kinase BaeS